jgi:hypothetical protein
MPVVGPVSPPASALGVPVGLEPDEQPAKTTNSAAAEADGRREDAERTASERRIRNERTGPRRRSDG